jgi:hypothetical protein
MRQRWSFHELPIAQLQVRDDPLGHHLAVNAIAIASRFGFDLRERHFEKTSA